MEPIVNSQRDPARAVPAAPLSVATFEALARSFRRQLALGLLGALVLPALLLPLLLKIAGLPPQFAPYAQISWPTALYVLVALPACTWLVDLRLRRRLAVTAAVLAERPLRDADLFWLRRFAAESAVTIALYLLVGAGVVGMDAARALDAPFFQPSTALALLAAVILFVYAGIPLYLVAEKALGEHFGSLVDRAVLTPAWLRVFLSGPGVVLVTLTSVIALIQLLGMALDAGLLYMAATLTAYAIAVSLIAQRGENDALAPLFRFSEGSALTPREREELLEARSVDEIGRLVRDVRRVVAGEQEALAQVRASERRFRQFAEAASDWFFELDEELCFSWVSENFERILGVPVDSVIGLPAMGMSAVYRETDFAPHRDDLQERRPYRNYRFTVNDPSGRTRHLQVSAEPVFDDDGTFRGYRGAGSDITDLVETRTSLAARTAELLQAQKMEAVGQLTGGIAHDFNNLLTVVLGNLELARHVEAAERDGVLGEASAAALRGAELVRRLMAFSRKQTLQPERVLPARLIRSMEPLLRSALGESVELCFTVADDDASCFCDPGQLENAVLNLALNARDAMPGGGRLELRVGETEIVDSDVLAPGRYARLEVEDTGTGIEPAQLELVFEPFFTTKEQGEGTGLGLSMVYGFARQSGGNASIDSRLGEGTRITLLLPVQSAADRGVSDAGDGRSAGASGEGEHVLVVEDEDAVRTLVVKQLGRLGFHCVAFGRSAEALDYLRGEEHLDLLLTDIVLAERVDGMELARRARELRPQLPVVYMTGYTQQFDALESAFFVTKPFSVEELATMVRRALEAAGPAPLQAEPRQS